MTKYTPHTQDEIREMLDVVGVADLDALYPEISAEMKLSALDLPQGLSEYDVEKELNALAAKNVVFDTVLRGAGAYRHYIPAVVRNLSARQEFVTAYTPYQAELSQGILQSIFEYQTLICDLTGMDVSNASHYDGGTAAAEAALMCRDKGRSRIMVSAGFNPERLAVVRTYLEPQGMEITIAPELDGVVDINALSSVLDGTYAGFLLEQPNYFGLIEDGKAIGEAVHSVGATFVVSAEPISLGLLKRPSEYGADIVVGDGQPLGMSLAFGGPYLGFMACKKALVRRMPGRIVGQTVDHDGRRAYVLTLQAREQHIRREKASSNICSNQAHCALIASMYLATLGKQGLREVAQSCVSSAHYLCSALEIAGLERVYSKEFFDEFVTTSKCPASRILIALAANGILGGLPLDNYRILWCATELVDRAAVDKTAAIVVKEVLGC